METTTMASPKTHDADTHPCPCGCAPCAETCCDLDCLVAPRFFCGQLLTDQDLGALLQWNRDKFRLSRFRHGWGVACGLDVRCDPLHAGSVIVGRGYAVSCCGDDIIVCEDAGIDLSGACGDEIDPCEDLGPPRRTDQRLHARRRGRERENVVEHRRTTGVRHFPRWHERGEAEQDIRAVDLSIAYAEQASNPQTALGRSVCGQVSECEYSRTKETYTLRWEPAGSTDPLSVRATRWQEMYETTLEVVRAFRDQFGPLRHANGEDVRRWLLNWLDAHPPHHFCFVHDRVCGLAEDEFLEETDMVELLFWIVQDARQAAAACACFSCSPDDGVPLARIGLEQRHEGRVRACHVAGIDPYPPYRRPLGPTCWPAPLGSVNLGQVIWHRAEEACVLLADLGVNVAGTERFRLPETLSGLERALDCDVMVRCGDPRVIQIYDADPLGGRVIGFCGDSEPDEPRVGLDVTKTSKYREVRRGSTVVFDVKVTNSGAAPLKVSVEDDRAGELGQAELAPGEQKDFSYKAIIPKDLKPGERYTNTVTATGTSGRRRVRKSASYTLLITDDDREEPDQRSEQELLQIRGIGRARRDVLRDIGIVGLRELAEAPREVLREAFADDVSVRDEHLDRWQAEAQEQLNQ